MNKKFLSFVVAGIMAIGTLTGCGGGGGSDSSGSQKEGSAGVEQGASKGNADSGETSKDAIRLVNGKIEIDKPLKAIAEKYKEETGQEVVIESLGGGVDITSTLKGYYQAGNMPDMFVIGGGGDYKNWDGLCADLGDCEFAKNTEMAYKDSNGTVVGFPYAVEGYGITYNAEVLEKAGVDPATLTNYSAFEEAFKKIDRMKDELGLTAVCSVAAEAGQMYWSTGNHLFGYYLSGGLDRDDKTVFDKFSKGELDEKRLQQFGKFFRMLCDYSDEQTLISGTYDDQLALWAQGKTAFITEGNWIDASLADYNVTFDCGIVPYAFTEEDMTGVLADSPSWWCVYGDSARVDACKAFMDWLVTSEDGQNGLVKECGMVSPYNNCTLTPDFPLSTSLAKYMTDGNTYAWDWSNMPEGIAQNYTGYVFESLAKNEIDVDGFVSMLSSQVKTAVDEAAQQ